MKFLHPSFRLGLACVVLATLCACSGKEARISSHLEKAKQFLAQSDSDRALVEVRNVLQIDPKNADAYYVAGEVNEARPDYNQAYGNYAKAVELKPDFNDAKAGIARLQLVAGSTQTAQKVSDEVLSADPNNAQARVIRAALTARAGDYPGAIEMTRSIREGQNMPSTATLLLAGLYIHEKKSEEASKVVNQALASAPNNIELLLAEAKICQSIPGDEHAPEYFERAVKAAPRNSAAWHDYAAYYDSKGKYADAERILREATKVVPDDSARNLALADYIGQRQGSEAELKELLSQSDAYSRDFPVKFALAKLYHAAGDTANTTKVLQQIVSADGTGPSGIAARDQLVVLDLEAGDTKAARARLEEVLKINPRDGAALVQRGRLELADHQLDQAIADLRSAAKDRPDAPDVLALLADAYQADKQPQLAKDTIADSVKLYPHRPELAVMQVEFLMRLGQTPDALAAADDALRTDPSNARLYEMKAYVQEQSKDFAGAEGTLKALADKVPDNPVGPMSLAQLYLRENKPDAALAQFDIASVRAPNSYDAQLSALTLLTRQKRFADVDKRAADGLKRQPNSAMAYQLLGHVKTAEGDNQAAQAAYQHAIELAPKAVTSYIALAAEKAKAKDQDGVLATLEAGIKANPDNQQLLAEKAGYLTQTKQYDAAIATYNIMVARNPTDSVAANNLAYILTEIKGDPASLQRALALSERFQYSTNAGLVDTLGWAHYKLGQNADALPLLQKAASIAPQTPLFQLHYGLALLKSGNVTDAKQHLKSAADGNMVLPDDARKVVEQG